MAHVRSRAAAIAASLAIAASFFATIGPASAQSCPTSGGGTTCFGGQKWCPSNGQCYNPPSTCTGGQVMDCNACGCVCPAGKTICSATGTCVTNRTCPAGTNWDPCTDTCGTPYVLLSPSSAQNGFVNVTGDLMLGGNLRLDQAAAAGRGEVYFANGKALHVDGAGTTGLSFVNATGTGLNLNLPASTKLCFGAACRNSWPSSADFDPSYLNVGGDTMTGLLTLGGGLRMASGAGAGKVLQSDASGNASWQTISAVGGSGSANYLSKFTASTTLGNSQVYDNGTGVGIGTTTPGSYRLNVSSSGDAASFGNANSWFRMWAGGNSRLSFGDGNGYEAGFISGGQNGSGQNTMSFASCQDGGSCPQYLTLNQSGNVGIGTNAPSYDLDVSGSIRATGNIVLGGVSRGSWPSLSTTTTYCQYNAGSGAGWKACYCPGGYAVTGWYGYNCENHGGEWECSASAPYGSGAVQVWHDSAATAYVWAQCARVN